MIPPTLGRRVFAYGGPVDMRKGFDGLYAVVCEELDQDPLSGDLFLFVSRNRIRAKVLVWDGTGLCVYAKRLEKGRFACLWEPGAETAAEKVAEKMIALSASELQLFLEGCELIGQMRLSPPLLSKKDFVLAKRVDTLTM